MVCASFLAHNENFEPFVYRSLVLLFVQACLWTLASVKYSSLGQGPSYTETNQLISRLSHENLLIAFLACGGLWQTRFLCIFSDALISDTSNSRRRWGTE
jgi:hypothetical protein